jgi:predicted ArsR family transcriptional regulator
MEGWSFLTEYPQLCEAETEAFGRLLGTPVQRPATIAHGDGDIHHACHRAIARAHRNTTIGTDADATTTESGGISA